MELKDFLKRFDIDSTMLSTDAFIHSVNLDKISDLNEDKIERVNQFLGLPGEKSSNTNTEEL